MQDLETVYWFQNCELNYQSRWASHILEKYKLMMYKIDHKTSAKFYNLPVKAEDFSLLKYEIIIKCLLTFQTKYQKSFKNFLLKQYEWRLFNYAKSFLTHKHQALNCAQNQNTVWQNRPFDIADPTSHHVLTAATIINPYLKFLTAKESEVISLKLQNWTMSEIVAGSNQTYQQVDNSYQRAVKKLKNLIN